MNYRHAFHAGNHADVLKHLILLQIAEYMAEKPAPFWIIDTHAGAGGYDLDGELARRTGEAAQGIFRLMAADDAPVAPRKSWLQRMPWLLIAAILLAAAGMQQGWGLKIRRLAAQ